MPDFDPKEYKINSRANWNAVAHEYHINWADSHIGPFKSTAEIVKIADIGRSDKVLDIACGTGAVSKQVIRYLGKDGTLTGVDMSRTALSIAKQSIKSSNANFFEMDAENISFQGLFDKILCQYGLMFFPDATKVLKTARRMLARKGKIAIAVHGTADEVPYFSSIMKPILKHIPDIRAKGSPTVHRFGKDADLEGQLECAGFSDIAISKHVFRYEPGTFEEYWHDYMHSTANSIRPRLENADSQIQERIREESEQNVTPYLKDGKIIFPWAVLIASAR